MVLGEIIICHEKKKLHIRQNLHISFLTQAISTLHSSNSFHVSAAQQRMIRNFYGLFLLYDAFTFTYSSLNCNMSKPNKN